MKFILRRICVFILPILIFNKLTFALIGAECVEKTEGNYHFEKIEPKEVKKEQKFLKIISRTENIKRWGLLENRKEESLNDHLLSTARIVHMLVTIKNKIFKGNIDVGKAVISAIYHDTLEVLTGDMPTPVKYSSLEMKSIYSKTEDYFQNKLLETLPKELKEEYESVLEHKENEIWKIVKAADILDAAIKCAKEKSRGNEDFKAAEKEICTKLMAIEDDAVIYFIKHFLPAFGFKIVKIEPTIKEL